MDEKDDCSEKMTCECGNDTFRVCTTDSLSGAGIYCSKCEKSKF